MPEQSAVEVFRLPASAIRDTHTLCDDLCYLDLNYRGLLAYDHPRAHTLLARNPVGEQAPHAAVTSETIEDLEWVDFRHGVAFVRIRGLIRPEPVWYSRAASVQSLTEAVEILGDRKDVREIVLYTTSGGGIMGRQEDFNAVVRQVREVKPVKTFAHELMASAAAWMGFSAEEVICDPLADVGSLGVYMMLFDESKFWKDIGLVSVVVASGRYKGLDARDDVPKDLVDDTKRLVDDAAEIFRAAVERDRGLSGEALEAVFDGRVWTGTRALERGLVDRVLTFPEFLKELDAHEDRATLFNLSQEDPMSTNSTEASAPAPEEAPETVAAEESSARTMGAIIAGALRSFGLSGAEARTPSPEPSPRFSESQRSRLLKAAQQEVRRHAEEVLSKQGVNILPGQTAGVDAFASIAAGDLLRGAVDDSLPALSMAVEMLGKVTAADLFPEVENPAAALATAWGSLPQRSPEGQTNLAAADRETEALIPQGQRDPDGSTPSGQGWASLSAEERKALEQAGMNAETYDEWQAAREARVGP